MIRLVFLSEVDYDDVTFTSVPAVLMSAVEPSLAVLLACIPLLRPLVAQDRRLGGRTKSGKISRLTTWMSSQWSRSKTLDLSKKGGSLRPAGAAGLVRLGSSEVPLSAGGSGMRSAILNHSRCDSDDGMELRYVLNPGEGVSHHACVEALPPRSRGSLVGEHGIEAASGGLAIMIQREWNVEIEPKAS